MAVPVMSKNMVFRFQLIDLVEKCLAPSIGSLILIHNPKGRAMRHQYINFVLHLRPNLLQLRFLPAKGTIKEHRLIRRPKYPNPFNLHGLMLQIIYAIQRLQLALIELAIILREVVVEDLSQVGLISFSVEGHLFVAGYDDFVFEVQLREEVHERVEFVFGARFCEVSAVYQDVSAQGLQALMGVVCVGDA